MNDNMLLPVPWSQPELAVGSDVLRRFERGTKRAIVTSRPVDARPGPMRLTGAFRLVGTVEQVIQKRVRKLTEEDAVAAGFGDVISLYEALKFEDRTITPESPISVVRFSGSLVQVGSDAARGIGE